MRLQGESLLPVPLGFGNGSQTLECIAQIIMRLGILGLQTDHFFKTGTAFFKLAAFLQDNTKIVPRTHHSGVTRDSFAPDLFGLGQLAALTQHFCQIAAKQSGRVRCRTGLPQIGDGFIRIAFIIGHQAKHMQGIGLPRHIHQNALADHFSRLGLSRIDKGLRPPESILYGLNALR